MNKPIVRFAPSPTGYLHIGGARTALFNWLYANKNNGKFLLRIEDTDLERSKSEYIDQITDALSWLGLDWDDDIVLQSKNKSRHEEVVHQMIEAGTAYRCFLSKEELDDLRKKSEEKKELFRVPKTYRDCSLDEQQALIDDGKSFTVRLKIPEGITEFSDLVYGTIKVDNKELDDFIIARSDGSPTYNFVVAIDDSDMNITHVIRGDDHLANTPKQILVYQALGLEIPTFAHLPMILGSDKKRLSKRHAATNVQEYRDKGFTPDTIINYLSLLGWNPDSNKEIFTTKELIKSFKFEQVQKKPATFDEKKLLWISGKHIEKIDREDLMEQLQSYKSNEEGFWNTISGGMPQHFTKGKEDRYRLLDWIKGRCKTLDEVATIGNPFFYSPDINLDDEVLKDSIPILKDFLSALKISDYERLTPNDIITEEMESIFQDLMTQHDVGIGKVMKPIRYALFGLTFGPDLIGSMNFIGKLKVEHRIEALLEGE